MPNASRARIRPLLPICALAIAACETAPGDLLPPPDLETTFTITNTLSSSVFVRVVSPGSYGHNWTAVTTDQGTALMRDPPQCPLPACGAAKVAPVDCIQSISPPVIEEIASGESFTDTWNATYWEVDQQGLCVTQKIAERREHTVWICFGYDRTADGSELAGETCTSYVFRVGTDRAIVHEVSAAEHQPIDFVIENRSAGVLYVQATAACTSAQGWVAVSDSAGDAVFPSLWGCIGCRCGSNQCYACSDSSERACISPTVAEVAQGGTVTTTWDGYYTKAETTGGPNGGVCAHPTYATEGQFKARFCWSKERSGQENFGELINPTCREQTFAIGGGSEVRAVAE